MGASFPAEIFDIKTGAPIQGKATLEAGYTRISNLLMKAMCLINLTTTESRLVFFIFLHTYAWGIQRTAMSDGWMAKKMGLQRPNINRVKRHLIELKILDVKDGKLGINSNVAEWTPLADDPGCINFDTRPPERCINPDTQPVSELIQQEDDTNLEKEILNKNITTAGAPARIDKSELTVKQVQARFAQFYQAYPKHRDRAEAENLYLALPRDSTLYDRIDAHVAAMQASGQWDDPQYVRSPARYLRRKNWEDEVPGYALQQLKAIREFNQVIGGDTVPETFDAKRAGMISHMIRYARDAKQKRSKEPLAADWAPDWTHYFRAALEQPEWRDKALTFNFLMQPNNLDAVRCRLEQKSRAAAPRYTARTPADAD
jgi:phage replication O-like protein O